MFCAFFGQPIDFLNRNHNINMALKLLSSRKKIAFASAAALALVSVSLFFYVLAPQKVWVIAHRGAAAYEPENTLAAFQKAIDLGADGVELDVHRSADGVLVVIHDSTVDRTTNGTGSVSQLDLAQLKSLDAGKGQKIPTLREALDLVKGKLKIVQIEMKAMNTEAALARELRESGIEPKAVYVGSFFGSSVKRFKEIAPEFAIEHLQIGVVPEAESEKFVNDIISDTGAKVLSSAFSVTHKRLVDAAHARGMKVYVWTVNDERTANEMLSLGVDGIITDKPDVIRRIIESR